MLRRRKKLNAGAVALAAMEFKLGVLACRWHLTLPLKSMESRHVPLAARVLAYIGSLTRKRVNVDSWPDSEGSERPDDFRFLGYSGLVVLTASLSESGPEAALKLPELSERRAQESSECAGAAEEMADTQVLVGAVLVVVIVDERHDDKGDPQRIEQFVGRHAATHHADAHGRGIDATAREGPGKGALRPGAKLRINRRKGRLAATRGDERGDLVMFGALLVGRLALSEVVALGPDVILDCRDQISRVSAWRGAKIDFSDRMARQDVRRFLADSGGRHAADVERWKLQSLLVIAAHRLRFGDAKALEDRGFIIGDFRHYLALGIGELHAVIITLDGDTAAVVLHAGEQCRESLRRIRRIVS